MGSVSVPRDPNGHAWPILDWRKLGYASYESFIEAKAGASPDDWPLTHPVWPPNDEALAVPAS